MTAWIRSPGGWKQLASQVLAVLQDPLRPELLDVFFEPGEPRTRRIFVRNAQGQITGFVDRREARDILWRRSKISG
jgi:hypothetical protein